MFVTILFRYPWSGHLVKGSPWHTLLEYVRRLQYLNHLFRNLCQGYEVRLWHILFNQFQADWINDAPCLRYFIQTKIACDQERKAAWLGENWTCVMFQSLVHTCPYFFWSQIWSFDFLFLRAMVLNRDSKVKSPWFETRSGKKNSATSQLLGSSARKFRRWSFTCVSEAANWTPFCNELCFLNPFSQLLDCRSIVVFLICR